MTTSKENKEQVVDWSSKMYFVEMMRAFAAKEIHKGETTLLDGSEFVLTPSKHDGALDLRLRWDKDDMTTWLKCDSYPAELFAAEWHIYRIPVQDSEPDTVSYEEMIDLAMKNSIDTATMIGGFRSYRFGEGTVKVCEPGTEPAIYPFLLSDVHARFTVKSNPLRVKYDTLKIPKGSDTIYLNDVSLHDAAGYFKKYGDKLEDYDFVIGVIDESQRIIMEKGELR